MALIDPFAPSPSTTALVDPFASSISSGVSAAHPTPQPITPNDHREQAVQASAFNALAAETHGPRFAKYLKIYGTKRAGEYANQLDLLIQDYPLYSQKIESMINRAYDPNTIKKIIDSQVRAEQQRQSARVSKDEAQQQEIQKIADRTPKLAQQQANERYIQKATGGIEDPVQASAALTASVNVDRTKQLLANETDPAKQQQLKITLHRLIQDKTAAQQLPPDSTTAIGVASQQALSGVGPLGGGLVGAEAGGAIGSAAGPVGSVVGGLIGMVGGGIVGSKLQDAALKGVLSPETYAELQRQLEAGQREHPMAAQLGASIPSLAMFAPNKFANDAVRKLTTRGAEALSSAERQAVIEMAYGAGTMTALDAANQIASGHFEPLNLALAAIQGAALPKMRGTGESPIAPERPLPSKGVPLITLQEKINASAKALQAEAALKEKSNAQETGAQTQARSEGTGVQQGTGGPIRLRDNLELGAPQGQEAAPVVGPVSRESGVSRLPGEAPVPIAYPAGSGTGTELPRKFLARSQKPENTPPPVLESLAAVDPQTYEQHATSKALDETKVWLTKSPDNIAEAERMAYGNDPPSAKKGVVAVALLDHYRKTGNVKAETALTEHMDRQFRESGRFIQAASFWAKMSGGGMKKSFRNFLKDRGVTLPDATMKEIDAKFDAASKMPDGDARTKAVGEAIDHATSFVPVKWGDMFDAYRYTNMLSNPKSHMRNIFGNTLNAIITRPASLIGQGDIKGTATYIKNATTAIGDAWQAAVDSFASTTASKFVEGGIQTGKGAFSDAMNDRLPGWLKVIPKTLQAQDQFFGKLIEAGETARLIKKGISPEAAANQAKQLSDRYLYREKIGKDMKDQSLNSFSRALDGIGSLLDYGTKIPVVGKGLGWFVPFVRTPINIAKMGVEASPLAYVGTRKTKGGISYPAMTMTKNDIAKAHFGKSYAELSAPKKPSESAEAYNQRVDSAKVVETELKERQGLAMPGTMITLTGAMLAQAGRTTWAAPDDEEQKRAFYASGRKPYSVLVGDKWIPMATFGPYALALAIPAAARDSFHDDPKMAGTSYERKMLDVALGLSQFFVSSTPVSGAAAFFNAATGKLDTSLERAAGFVASQSIPLSGLVRYVNQWVDPYFRRPKGFFETIQSDWPILSQSIEPYTNPYGTPAQRTLSDILPPYSIGKQDKQQESAYQDRGSVLRSREKNNRQADSFVSLIRSGKVDRSELDQFLSTLPEDERTRLISRLREKGAGDLFPKQPGLPSLPALPKLPKVQNI